MSSKILQRLGLISSQQKDEAFLFVKRLIASSPRHIQLYKLAFTHKSNTSNHELHLNNERLEYLGDAVLDAIVSDILYKRYPYKSEGELTRYRSNVVKRATLNRIALSLDFEKMLIAAPNANISKRLYGDMLEAFIGALYLDKGYRFTHTFVRRKIIDALLSDEDVVKERNYKSRLLEWGQQYKKSIVFKEKRSEDDAALFLSSVLVDGQEIAQGQGRTKKESHNAVARKALKIVKA